MKTKPNLETIRKLLCALQDHIRDALMQARVKSSASFATIAAVTAADTIYQVDKLSEEAIFHWFEKHWPKNWPVELVMEGIEDDENVTFPRGTPAAKTMFKCILDPIDGTRNLMYDKRSAWILTGVALQRGAKNTLADIVVAAMTELPTSKMWRADQISGVRGAGIKSTSFNLLTRKSQKLVVRPSQATDFKHGFSSIARFFPEGKALLAQFEEDIWEELYGLGTTTSPMIFDDQYIATGGQLYELLIGHDRMIGDLRPLAFAKLGLKSSLVCHPYDICTAFLLQEAGGIVEGPDGKPLTQPLDTTSAIAWMGYANPVLAKQMRPLVKKLIKKHF